MMLEERTRLVQLLIKHEGLRLKPYLDTVGKTTIGVGRNISDRGITEMEAMFLLRNDVDIVEKQAIENFSWFKTLSPNRRIVVLSMIFNLGLEAFSTFKATLLAITNGAYSVAADHMLASKWATQVGLRAQELAELMRKG